MRCPDDLALIGFSDRPWSVVTDPPLTAVAQPAPQMGQQAVERLLDLIHRGQAGAPECVTLPCRLVIRRSRGCARAVDVKIYKVQVLPMKN